MASKIFRRPWTVDAPSAAAKSVAQRVRERVRLGQEIKRARDEFGQPGRTIADIQEAARRQERQAGPVRTALDMQRDVFEGREPRELGDERDRRRERLRSLMEQARPREPGVLALQQEAFEGTPPAEIESRARTSVATERVRELTNLSRDARDAVHVLSQELEREGLTPAEFVYWTNVGPAVGPRTKLAERNREALRTMLGNVRDKTNVGLSEGGLAAVARILNRLGATDIGGVEAKKTAPAFGALTVAGRMIARGAGRTPVVGESAQRILEPAIGTDVGLATTALGGVGTFGVRGTAAGTAGAIGASELGRRVPGGEEEIARIPTPYGEVGVTPRGIAEVAGGLAGAGAVTPGIGERAAARVGAPAVETARGAPLEAGVRRGVETLEAPGAARVDVPPPAEAVSPQAPSAAPGGALGEVPLEAGERRIVEPISKSSLKRRGTLVAESNRPGIVLGQVAEDNSRALIDGVEIIERGTGRRRFMPAGRGVAVREGVEGAEGARRLSGEQRVLGLEPAPAAPARPPAPQAQAGAELAEEAAQRPLPVAGASRAPPTAREIEARSRPLTPEVQAALAPDVDVRVGIEDWDTVSERFGERYFENVFTKLDDITASTRGVTQRPLQKAVRNAMVQRDIYVATQGERMKLGLYDWIGRNRQTLGLGTRGGNKGKALAVQVREGANIDRRLAQRLDDLVSHPEDYVPTPEQQAALEEADDIFMQVLRAEQRHGVNVQELTEPYWTRLITKTPRGESHAEAATNISTRLLGGRPFYTKTRAIPDLRQVYAAGYETADPLTAMETRLTLAPETIANRRVTDAIRGLGRTPGETVPETAKDALRTAQADYSAARKASLGRLPKGTAKADVKAARTRQMAELQEAEVALDQAKRAMRREATLAMQRRPQIAGRIVKQDVYDEASRYLETDTGGMVDDFFRALRGYKVSADAGSAFIQNWTTFWRNPVGWLKGMAVGGRGIAGAPYDYVVRNLDSLEQASRYGGVVMPDEFLLNQGGGISRAVGGLPVIKQGQNFFEWNILGAQHERWKGVMNTAKTEDQFLDLASTLRKQAGSTWMPGLTKAQARTMAATWFAPKYVAALHGALVDPLTKTGPARMEAIRALGSAFGGAAMATVALNTRLNGELPNMDDPDKPGFWGVRIGDSYVYPFGPFQPTIVALTRSARAAADTAQGRKPRTKDLQAWPQFTRGKLSIPAGIVVEALEMLGLPIDVVAPGYGRPPSRYASPAERLKEFVAEQFAPIGPRAAAEGIMEDEPAALLEPLGVRTTQLTDRAKFIDDHPDAEEKLSKYNAIETSERDRREKFRTSNSELDALLYIQGDVTTVKSNRAARLVEEATGEKPKVSQ